MGYGKMLGRIVKNVYTACSPTYRRTAQMLRSTEHLPQESLRALQLDQVKEMLIHAQKKAPYYRETFRRAGVDAREVTDLGDIESFPFLTKETYRDRVDEFIADDVPRALLIRLYTGGTTGAPVPLLRTFPDFARERAFADYAYQTVGMDPFCKSVYMRGEVNDRKGRYYYVGNFGKTLYLSAHNTSDENMALYVDLIRRFRPLLLYTLPSVAALLASFMQSNGIAPFDELRWAFCPSEELHKFQKELIESVLRCRIGTFYGHAEHAALAVRCTESEMYHVVPQYGYVELIGEDGKPVTEEGGRGEIVATAFANRCCPLVRYRTGDYAVRTTRECPCGRRYPMWERLEGRGQALAVSKDGGRISIGPSLLCTIQDPAYGKIRQFEMEQRRAGEIIVRIVPHTAGDAAQVTAYIENAFAEQFPGRFDVEVLLCEALVRSGSGKHRYFVQHLPDLDDASGGGNSR